MLGHRKLEVADYLAILKRRRWLIAVCVIVFPVAAGVTTRFIAPRYLSQTLVLIEEQKVPEEYVKPVISSDLDSRLASMKEQILSRSRIEPIIQRYNLYAAQHLSMDDRIDLARRSIEIKPIHSAITNSGGLPGFFIFFTASDAQTARLVCGEITTLFLNENLRSREESAQGTTDFLKGQLNDAKRNLDEQDAKLAAFQRQYFGKLPGEEQPNLNMLTSLNTQLEAATQALARMEQDKTYAESMLSQQLQSTPAAGSPAAIAASPQGEALKTKQAQLQTMLTEETDLTSRYTADHPDVIAKRREIADMRRQIAQLKESVAATTPAAPANPASSDSLSVQQLRAQIRAADIGIQAKRKEQEQLQTSVRMYQDRIQSSPLVEEQYKELTRDYDTAQKFYDDLLTKMNHSEMATALEHRQEGEQFRIMDEPSLPDSPVYPKVPVFVMEGLAFGLAIAAIITVFLEYRDTALRTERDVWAFTKLPTLAIIPLAGIIKEEKEATGKTRLWKRGPDIKPPKDSLAGARG